MPERTILGFLAEILRTLARFVRGQVLIASWMTLIYAAGFFLLDVPLWPLIALVCGMLHLVPVIGAVLGLLVPVGVSLIAGRSAAQILGIIGVFAFTQALESFYLTPRILGTELRLKPVVVFLALMAGGLLFGFFGALFAVPAVAVAMLAWRIFYRKEAR